MITPFHYGDKVYHKELDKGGTVIECIPAGYNHWLVKLSFDSTPHITNTVSYTDLKLINTLVNNVVEAAKTLTKTTKSFKPYLICENGLRIG